MFAIKNDEIDQFSISGDIKTKKVMMTPEMAKAILKNNNGNRNLRPLWVNALVNAINNDQWQFTHQAIAISSTGRLLDGQHRLSAIILANKAVPILVAENCDESSFAYIDKGVKRCLADNLSINKKVAEIYSFMLKSYGFRYDSPAAAISLQNSDVGFISEYLINTCNTTRRGASTAAVKAAAVVCAYQTRQIDVICDNYRNFILVEYDKMTPGLKLLERQISTGTANSGKTYDMYARACKAFYMFNEMTSILKISENEVKNYFSILGNIVEENIQK